MGSENNRAFWNTLIQVYNSCIQSLYNRWNPVNTSCKHNWIMCDNCTFFWQLCCWNSFFHTIFWKTSGHKVPKKRFWASFVIFWEKKCKVMVAVRKMVCYTKKYAWKWAKWTIFIKISAEIQFFHTIIVLYEKQLYNPFFSDFQIQYNLQFFRKNCIVLYVT